MVLAARDRVLGHRPPLGRRRAGHVGRSRATPGRSRTVAHAGRSGRVAAGRPTARDLGERTGDERVAPSRGHAARVPDGDPRRHRQGRRLDAAATGLPVRPYLRRIEADGTLRATALALATTDGGTDAGRTLERWRRGAGEALATVLPEPEAGLAAGILIGLRDLVDRDLAAAFTTAGVSHVVAISGWNIAIVAAAVGACAGRLGRRRRSIVTVLAIVAYVAFAGASASVIRAGLMAGVVLLARESGRAGQAATALGWTVALLLLADPGLVLDAGLQLSALATAGLIAWATPIGGALDRLGRGRLAGLAHGEPGRLAGGAGGDTPAHPRVVRAAVARRPGGQPRRRPAGRAGDGGRPRRARCRCARHRRRAMGRRRGPRGTGLGPAAGHRLDRPGGCRPPVRERRARRAPRCR